MRQRDRICFQDKFISRRQMLSASAIGIGGVSALAGCLEVDPSTAGEISNETDTPTASPGKNTPTETRSDDETPTEIRSDDETPTETQEETEQGGNWYIRPENSSSTVLSQLVCDEDHEGRFPQRFEESELEWGNDTDGIWEIRVETLNAVYGDTVTVRLRNVSDKTEYRSSRNDFNIQVETEVGWQEVRVKEQESDAATHDALHAEESGEGVKWEITMTESDLPDVQVGRGKVCPGLPSGRYRFVLDGTETQPIGVAFDFKN